MHGDKKNLCGDKIRAARKAKGLKQIDLVTALETDFGVKMDSTTLGRIERFERGVWDYELKAISEILEVPIDELFNPTN